MWGSFGFSFKTTITVVPPRERTKERANELEKDRTNGREIEIERTTTNMNKIEREWPGEIEIENGQESENSQ